MPMPSRWQHLGDLFARGDASTFITLIALAECERRAAANEGRAC